MAENNLIRSMVRGSYQIQKLRIQMGNRITANFKAKLGLTSDGMTEAELEKQEKNLLDRIRASYARITDGIIAEGEAGSVVEIGKFPSLKKFVGDELISSYAELVLVDQYMELLRNENNQFKRLGSVLVGIPIYDHFLSKVPGIGPAMAGVIVSEIDITKAEYPTSLHVYAGLDAVVYGKYTNDKGVEKTVRAEEVDAWLADNPDEQEMLAEGKYLVTFTTGGRCRKDWALVKRTYTDKEGKECIRDSISFNPFLKTKLVGVMGTSFLRSGKTLVDGIRMGAAKQLEYAVGMGLDITKTEKKDIPSVVLAFLKENCDVVFERSEFTQAYYNYKQRLENSPHHVEKTDLHRHNMALRYAVKRFLNVLYREWRTLEGLVVAEPYEVAVLGIEHGVASEAKNNLQRFNPISTSRNALVQRVVSQRGEARA